MEKQNGKVVEMKKSENVEQPQKMSYEQLENIAHQLSEQNRQLFAKLQEANMANIFKRMDYLFKVVENYTVFGRGFLDKCVAEIESMMILPEAKEEPDTPDTKSEE